ncbi:MAG: hypothetical protein ACLUPX_04355 [Atopobiaceae bacterium]
MCPAIGRRLHGQGQARDRNMTCEERAIVKAGCLINYNRAKAGK